MRSQYFSALLLSTLAAACPLAHRQAATATAAAPGATPTPGSGSGGSGGGSKVDMAKAIAAVMPQSSSCDGADFPDECRTAEQAAPFISEACADLSDGECAATVALMGLESVDMRFKHNVSPGRPGQGTANMQMADFNKEYASELFGADKVAGKSPDEILAMVMPDEHNFGSAAWFLKTKCADVRDTLKAGTDAGWSAYNQCIGVDGSLPDRMKYWTAAKAAFGL
ncbi:hypothetical protein CHGG_00743 [Chaetomium globosum CBS 148.51]|uniref:Transglycosylase SLT domain-containing protein n=1 Tax=Chaetomium globosum (strain ATCC 6205 / CBS 148.51 / DSM 1962 / NBRC 6347 / NRRL 1970) TaxID=306901 RepID=Q2HGB1_CHAGB|nr:uncharacterized protein CHGG_00743 [Chaetomium globosum CBS 148.51]EAQ92508.1 hypothetical protein CHGG_00743 [Chaetomium globosum CBS 148.51]